jgi:chlorophyllide a reductase subunit Z
MVQEVCNALFDALFHILPLSTDMDQVEATPGTQAPEVMVWTDAARELLDEILEQVPPLVRISTAKHLRDLAERVARNQKGMEVDRTHVERAHTTFVGRRPTSADRPREA